MTRFQHYNPVRILAGPGVLNRLGDFLPTHGPILLVTSPGWVNRGITARIAPLVAPRSLHIHIQARANPELDDLDAALARLRLITPAAIVAVGGGSVLDAAKVIAVTLQHDHPAPLHKAFRNGATPQWSSAVPLTAVPTTLGTGAEVTPFATVWDHQTLSKHSVQGDTVYPAHALLDPELTLGLPPRETLFTGLDATSHALESLWNRHRTPLTEACATQALTLIHDHLPNTLHTPGSLADRSGMQAASMLAGFAISQTRTAIAHSISYPLTLHHHVPHGLAAGFCLPALIDKHLRAQPDHPASALLRSVGKMLTSFNLPGYMAAFVNREQAHALRQHMFLPARAANYTHPMSDAELASILNQSLH